jgi:hypothetical protein
MFLLGCKPLTNGNETTSTPKWVPKFFPVGSTNVVEVSPDWYTFEFQGATILYHHYGNATSMTTIKLPQDRNNSPWVR